MALGTERGLAFAEERRLPAYLLTRENAGRLRDNATTAIVPMLIGALAD